MTTDYVYAVMDNDGWVINIVSADNPDAEVPLRLLIPDAARIVLSTEDTGPAYIGGDMLESRFRAPSPFASWQFDTDSWSWEAPIPYPEDGKPYIWDEETISWIEFPPVPIEVQP